MKKVYFISDGTGITIQEMGNVILSQFQNIEFETELFSFVNNEQSTLAIIEQISLYHDSICELNNLCYNGEHAIDIVIISSIVDVNIRNKFNLSYVLHIDIFAYFIPIFEQKLHIQSTPFIGRRHSIYNEQKYYARIDAISFSLGADDGVNTKNYDAADVIIFGVSRVGKTPICLYLAVNYGIKAANYPLTDKDLLSELLPTAVAKHQNKLIGLTTDPLVLSAVREHRFAGSHYASVKQCATEINHFNKIVQLFNIPLLNSNHRSIEELSTSIIQIMKLENKSKRY